MRVTRAQQGPISVLSIDGPLIEEALESLDTVVSECLETAIPRVLLDIRLVPFIDSAGLERIEGIATNIGRRGGEFRLCSPNDVCRDIFIATRLDSLVQTYADRDAAVASMQ